MARNFSGRRVWNLSITFDGIGDECHVLSEGVFPLNTEVDLERFESRTPGYISSVFDRNHLDLY